MRRRWKQFLAESSPPLIAGFIRTLALTLRYRLEDPQGILARDPGEARIWAFWHNRILMMPYLYERFCPGRRMLMLVSRSRDGEFITRIMNRFGIDGARGSSSRGATDALRELLRELDRPQARDIGITPDGPRGPRAKVQDGVLGLAALVQVCATLPSNYIAFEYPVGRPDWWYDIVTGLPNPIVQNSMIEVWDRPGMGVTLNPEAARRYLPAGDEDIFD